MAPPSLPGRTRGAGGKTKGGGQGHPRPRLPRGPRLCLPAASEGTEADARAGAPGERVRWKLSSAGELGPARERFGE